MMLYYPIILPLILGFLCLLIPRKLRGAKEVVALLGSLATFVLTILIFWQRPIPATPLLRLDNLASFILLAVTFFGFIIALYSVRFMAANLRRGEYYAYLLWSIAASCGVVLSDSLVLLLVFWGFLGVTLYLLIGIGNGLKATEAAKKSLVIVGGGDALMLFAIGIIWYLKESLYISEISLPLNNTLAITSFIALALASFAKIGAMPLHSWIPDMAETAPAPALALLPASLDKLLGIYLLGRIALELFVMNQAMALVLMVVGGVTIIASVMMALVQSNMKRLISYLNISAAGYMLIGIATGNPVGIAGGLFYLLCTSIWTSCLFLCSGAVESQTETTEFGSLGGLAKAMPVTFISCLIAGISVSGVPPFSGFVSKWMIYQGLIELGRAGDRLWIVWLVAAMFGSALTLAIFMKLIHATFLGVRSNDSMSKASPYSIKEVSGFMWLPMVILALLCVVFGIFAYSLPLKYLIIPSLKGEMGTYPGFWASSLATGLILIGIVLGIIIYALGNIKSLRKNESYVGGEAYEHQMRVSGLEFYNTIKDLGVLKNIYAKAERKLFDIYEQGRRLLFSLAKVLRLVHTGSLPLYLFWFFWGWVILALLLKKG